MDGEPGRRRKRRRRRRRPREEGYEHPREGVTTKSGEKERGRSRSRSRERDVGMLASRARAAADVTAALPPWMATGANALPVGGGEGGEGGEGAVEKEKPNLGLSGALAADANTKGGVVHKYSAPGDAATPASEWRMYVFKGEELLEKLRLSGADHFVFGRDPVAAQVVTLHPSCSGQHAVVQFRRVVVVDPESEERVRIIKPYLMDLESTNGTTLNGVALEGARYYELQPQDVVQFGGSTRDYVVVLVH